MATRRSRRQQGLAPERDPEVDMPSLQPTSYKGWIALKMIQLRYVCGQRNLPTMGSKDTLVLRIMCDILGQKVEEARRKVPEVKAPKMHPLRDRRDSFEMYESDCSDDAGYITPPELRLHRGIGAQNWNYWFKFKDEDLKHQIKRHNLSSRHNGVELDRHAMVKRLYDFYQCPQSVAKRDAMALGYVQLHPDNAGWVSVRQHHPRSEYRRIKNDIKKLRRHSGKRCRQLRRWLTAYLQRKTRIRSPVASSDEESASEVSSRSDDEGLHAGAFRPEDEDEAQGEEEQPEADSAEAEDQDNHQAEGEGEGEDGNDNEDDNDGDGEGDDEDDDNGRGDNKVRLSSNDLQSNSSVKDAETFPVGNGAIKTGLTTAADPLQSPNRKRSSSSAASDISNRPSKRLRNNSNEHGRSVSIEKDTAIHESPKEVPVALPSVELEREVYDSKDFASDDDDESPTDDQNAFTGFQMDGEASESLPDYVSDEESNVQAAQPVQRSPPPAPPAPLRPLTLKYQLLQSYDMERLAKSYAAMPPPPPPSALFAADLARHHSSPPPAPVTQANAITADEVLGPLRAFANGRSVRFYYPLNQGPRPMPLGWFQDGLKVKCSSLVEFQRDFPDVPLASFRMSVGPQGASDFVNQEAKERLKSIAELVAEYAPPAGEGSQNL